jgi:hypothetical protein
MRLCGVARQAKQLHVSLVELGLKFCSATQLGRANRGEIGRMRHQDAPPDEKIYLINEQRYRPD